LVEVVREVLVLLEVLVVVTTTLLEVLLEVLVDVVRDVLVLLEVLVVVVLDVLVLLAVLGGVTGLLVRGVVETLVEGGLEAVVVWTRCSSCSRWSSREPRSSCSWSVPCWSSWSAAEVPSSSCCRRGRSPPARTHRSSSGTPRRRRCRFVAPCRIRPGA